MERSFIEERIEEKMREIEEFAEELSEIVPDNFEKYKENFEKKAACERYAEKIPEAFVDLARITIQYFNLPSPQDDLNTFDILAQQKIISAELAEKLQNAKRMRNFLAHEYGKVDDEIIFAAVSSELQEDTKEYVKKINESLVKKERTQRKGEIEI